VSGTVRGNFQKGKRSLNQYQYQYPTPASVSRQFCATVGSGPVTWSRVSFLFWAAVLLSIFQLNNQCTLTSSHNALPVLNTMPKRTAAETMSDSDDESRQAGPSTPKRARRAGRPARSTSSAEGSRIRSNESSSEAESDDGTSDDQESLDLDALEEQIRTHIDATRLANQGRLGVRPLFVCFSRISSLISLPHLRPLVRRG
jgi:hypothetical protein